MSQDDYLLWYIVYHWRKLSRGQRIEAARMAQNIIKFKKKFKEE